MRFVSRHIRDPDIDAVVQVAVESERVIARRRHLRDIGISPLDFRQDFPGGRIELFGNFIEGVNITAVEHAGRFVLRDEGLQLFVHDPVAGPGRIVVQIGVVAPRLDVGQVEAAGAVVEPEFDILRRTGTFIDRIRIDPVGQRQ